MTWDAVVVGGGAAGLSAALVLGRARRRTLVVDAGEPSNARAHGVGGLLGRDLVPPGELYAAGRDEVAGYGVELRPGRVVRAAPGEVVLDDGARLESRALVLATGMHYGLPDVPGVAEHWGGRVFHCPFCHGWDVRDAPVVVLGEGEPARMKAALMRAWTDDVQVVATRDATAVDEEAVVRRDGTRLPCAGVLVHAQLRPRDDLHEQLGLELTDAGLVAVDRMGRTSVPGVFAVGDLAVAPQQVALAAASGALAAAAIVHDLLLAGPA